MMSRTRRLLAGLLIVAAPVAAQDTSFVMRSNDGKTECTIRVNDKRLPKDEEAKLCEQMQERSRRAALEFRSQRELLEREVGGRGGSMERQRAAIGAAMERQLEENRAATGAAMARQLEENRGALQRTQREAVTTGGMMLRELEASRTQREAVTAGSMARGRNTESARTIELDAARRSLTERAMAPMRARAIFGVTVQLDASANDRYGATISAVTPGRPADKAGIRARDIVTKVGNVSLAGGEQRRDIEEGRSLPGLRLTEEVAKLVPGKPVKVEIRRGDDNRTFTITPIEDPDAEVFTFVSPNGGGSTAWSTVPSTRGGRVTMTPATPTLEPRTGGSITPVPGGTIPGMNSFAFRILTNGALSSLELAPVNEKLGAYFGTNEGVLVINAGEKENLGLQPGDVITAVDGRKVSTPSQLMRVLGTYESGEEFKLQITRQKRSETITSRLTPPTDRLVPRTRSSGGGGNR